MKKRKTKKSRCNKNTLNASKLVTKAKQPQTVTHSGNKQLFNVPRGKSRPETETNIWAGSLKIVIE